MVGYEDHIYENYLVRLRDFADYLVKFADSAEAAAAKSARIEGFRKSNTNTDGTAGLSIYGYVKDMILSGM